MLKKYLVVVAAASMMAGATVSAVASSSAARADEPQPKLTIVRDQVQVPKARYAGAVENAAVMATCPDGTVRTGGGAAVVAGPSQEIGKVKLNATYAPPGQENSEWANATNSSTKDAATLHVEVTCASLQTGLAPS